MWSKKKAILQSRRILSSIFGHINTTLLWVIDDVLFCWKSNSEDCTGEVVGPLFTWTDWGINCNYESTLTTDWFVTHPTHGNEEKAFFKMAPILMMKELDVHIGGNAIWVSHDKAEFQKIRECSPLIWMGKYSLL